ncbi:terminase large subunit [Lacticaseibacillus suibinensis]|uniref:terminase large subunit n=1 Tax=Lacticaseibacillus suibinensis TaxID=2486011 RepID=UPI000F77E3E2|nr:terminase large subunit [Lacticaseibacillus suibinensis]
MDSFKVAKAYATGVIDGTIPANRLRVQAGERFLNDLKRTDEFDIRMKDADFVIDLIENVFVHQQGEDLEGRPMRGRPLLLTDWQKFCIVNMLCFYKKGTDLRRFHEVLIMIPRKQGKTTFAAALGFALSLLEARSGSKLYVLANSLKQTMESFSLLKFNIDRFHDSSYQIRDNNSEHSITKDFGEDGSIYIQALASDEKRLDSLNANLLILDELHAFKSAKKYILMKNAQKAYRNKLLIGISTAGDIPNGFLAQRVEYAKKVLSGQIKDDEYFFFICQADQNEDGDVDDFTSDEVLMKSNPSVGVSVSLDDLRRDAEMALNDPQTRLEFFNKTLNVFTASSKAYFDIEDFKASDRSYDWSLKDLAGMGIKWYGGADLSKLHDLTAAALYGRKGDTDIVITHAFFPRQAAHEKADKDGIPLFGWEDDGWLTMSNTATVLYDDIVKWFVSMRAAGFNIRKVGFDKKFGREFFMQMKKAHFKIVDQPQYFFKKSEGFRRIEMKAKNKELYYVHSEAYEYCVSNVAAVEKTDDMIQYDKIDGQSGNQRIDLFDASVFACVQMSEDITKNENASAWLKGGD